MSTIKSKYNVETESFDQTHYENNLACVRNMPNGTQSFPILSFYFRVLCLTDFIDLLGKCVYHSC